MSLNISDNDDNDTLMSDINTTPLVDVMLVLLIIFLITIPVITQTVPVDLPDVTNLPTQTKPENITIVIDRLGNFYWNKIPATREQILSRMKLEAVKVPQPEFHIRADKNVRYEFVGRVVVLCQRAGIVKVGFITQPSMLETVS